MGDTPAFELLLLRKTFTKKATIGELRLSNGDLLAYTLEDMVRAGPDNILQQQEKIKGATAVSAGRYELTVSYSSRFKQIMPILLGIQFFDGIRIHRGNTDADTEGCLLVGLTSGADKIMGSETAYERVCTKICDCMTRGQRVFLTIAGNPPDTFWKKEAA